MMEGYTVIKERERLFKEINYLREENRSLQAKLDSVTKDENQREFAAEPTGYDVELYRYIVQLDTNVFREYIAKGNTMFAGTVLSVRELI